MSQDRTHLMIVNPRYLPAILSGRKAVEARLAKDRRTPFGRVAPGEKVYIKATGGPVCAIATVGGVHEYEDLTLPELQHLRDTYEPRVLGGDTFWESKADARFATMIWLESVRPVTANHKVPEALLDSSRNAWRTMEHAPATLRAA